MRLCYLQNVYPDYSYIMMCTKNELNAFAISFWFVHDLLSITIQSGVCLLELLCNTSLNVSQCFFMSVLCLSNFFE